MPMGMLYISIVCFDVVEAYVVGIHISAWASALLVQTVMGNAKASECRDGQQVQTPALFLYVAIHYSLTPPAPGACRQKLKKQ